MNHQIAEIRKDYKLQTLLESEVAATPFIQFTKWWNEAVISDISEVNAMTLATATKGGIPSARIVLLKGFSEEGFIFFTNYLSHKGKIIEENPTAALVFFWKELERQVRIEGKVEKISSVENDLYYHSRPEGSKIGAWASPQSEVIKSREVIEENVRKYSAHFSGLPIERPSHWGGYMLKPNSIEFWQGRSSRLHDRLLYTLNAGEKWILERLAP